MLSRSLIGGTHTKTTPLHPLLECVFTFAAITVLCFAPQAWAFSSKGSVNLAAVDTGMEIELANQPPIMIAPNRTVSLRAGTYTVTSFTLAVKQGGKVWKIKCTRPSKKMQSLTVTEGGTTTLDVGPPFFVRASAQQLPPPNSRTVSVGLSIQDNSQQFYSTAVTVGSQQLPPPKFRIVDQKGNFLAAGQLEYG